MTPDEIHAARRKLRLSQAQLASRLGVTVGAVSRWERGEMAPQPYLWRAMRDLAAELARDLMRQEKAG